MKTKLFLMSAALCLSTSLFADDNSPIEKSESSESSGLTLGKPIGGHQVQLFNPLTTIFPKRFFSPFLVNVNNRFDKRYDDKGKKESLLGLDVNINTNAYGVYYGITDSMTYTISVPYVTGSQTKIKSATDLRASREYGLAKAGITSGIAAGLIQSGLCADMASCQRQIAQGMTFPTSNPAAGYSAGTPISAYAAGITDGYFSSHAVKEGDSGLGDISMTLNNQYLKTSDLALKSRVELITATGTFDVPDTQNPTGFGKNSTGVYGDVEYNIHKGVQAIGEYGFLYDLTASDADGVKTRYDGVGQRGGFYLGVDAGTYVSALRFFSFVSGYRYQAMPSQSRDSKTATLGNLPQSQSTSYSNSFRIAGFNYGIPAFLDYTRVMPISGKNDVAVQTSVFLLTTGFPI